jgi:copper oxidase (laccase) domain-containing protein
VHGARVVEVTAPGEHAGAEADAAVTAVPGCTLAVRTADCAPVVLLGTRTVGLVHAGWRGLVAGVVEATVGALTDLGDPPTAARLGPCIRPGCYEFRGPELAGVVERFGPEVRGTTSWGTPALDLPAAVRAALAPFDLVPEDRSGCTACDRRWYSHRARAEVERFATLAWLEPA